jgi:hypothetical protein
MINPKPQNPIHTALCVLNQPGINPSYISELEPAVLSEKGVKEPPPPPPPIEVVFLG